MLLYILPSPFADIDACEAFLFTVMDKRNRGRQDRLGQEIVLLGLSGGTSRDFANLAEVRYLDQHLCLGDSE